MPHSRFKCEQNISSSSFNKRNNFHKITRELRNYLHTAIIANYFKIILRFLRNLYLQDNFKTNYGMGLDYTKTSPQQFKDSFKNS